MSSSQEFCFCVFCLKSIQNKNKSRFFKFFICLKRFFGDKLSENLFNKLIQETHFKTAINCCKDCQSLLEAFCDFYCEIKYLELQLEWKLKQLIRIMKLASKVPTRVSNLNTALDKVFTNDKEEKKNIHKLIQDLRQRIIKIGCRKLLASQPRVLLKRFEKVEVETDDCQNLQFTTSQNIDHNKHVSILTFPDNESHHQSTLNSFGDPPIQSTAEFSDNASNHRERSDDENQNYCNANNNHGSQDDVHQQLAITQMKHDTDCLPKEKCPTIISVEQDVNSVTDSALPNENVVIAQLPTETKKSSISLNKFNCSHCKKKFKTKGWLATHNRKFHFEVVSTVKKETSTNNVFSPFKSEDDSTTNIASNSKDQEINERYNLREKRAPKFPTANEIESDDNDDTQSSTEYTSDSSSTTSTDDSEDNMKCKAATKRNDTLVRKLKSKYIVRKYRPRKGAHLKEEREEVNGVKCFRCKICKLTFVKPMSLKRHIFDHHKYKGLKIITNEKDTASSSSAGPIEVKFKCNFCEIVMEHGSDLAMHETSHVPIQETENRIKTKGDPSKYSKCPRCKFRYSQKSAYIRHHLKTHLKILDGNHSSACSMCSGGNVYIHNSKSHYNNFHNIRKLDDHSKISKCDLCSAFYLNARQLYRHKYLIHDQNNHKCEICDEVFQKRSRLRDHKIKHHKKWDEDPNLPIGCDMDGCKKRFKSEGEFEYHKHFHQNQTPWKYVKTKCLQCDKVFRSKGQLQGHMNKAHCEKICQECGKGFKTKSSLMYHMEYHKGPVHWKYQCDECGKKCMDKTKLNEHTRTHTKEKPYVCQFCGEKYAHRHNWRNHLKKKHDDEEGVNEEVRRNRRVEGAKYMSRKGSKKGDCIIAGGSTEPQK